MVNQAGDAQDQDGEEDCEEEQDEYKNQEDNRFLSSVFELSPNPQVDDSLILRLTYDLATGLHNPRAIAHRYGLLDEDVLREYLRAHPKIVEEARSLHAVFNSDTTTEERVRMKFLRATEQLVMPMASLAGDAKTPLGARIDCFKQIQRGAGMDGLSSTQRATAAAGSGGQPFNLTINFTGRPPVTIQGTTGSAEPDATPSEAIEYGGESSAADGLADDDV